MADVALRLPRTTATSVMAVAFTPYWDSPSADTMLVLWL
jgi:hypothetical protein